MNPNHCYLLSIFIFDVWVNPRGRGTRRGKDRFLSYSDTLSLGSFLFCQLCYIVVITHDTGCDLSTRGLSFRESPLPRCPWTLEICRYFRRSYKDRYDRRSHSNFTLSSFFSLFCNCIINYVVSKHVSLDLGL